jgi:phosphatidylglycerophosphate synthase
LVWIAAHAAKRSLHADQITLLGFVAGMTGAALIAWGFYIPAIFFLLANRLADGVDGTLARLTEPSDAGGFLDIVLDFLFYSAVVLGFAFAEPGRNALAAAVLLFSFVGTGSSFLAFAIMAERRGLQSANYGNKGFYYFEGLTEASETVLLFLLCCILPSAFPVLALCFAGLCLLTTVSRVVRGYRILLS